MPRCCPPLPDRRPRTSGAVRPCEQAPTEPEPQPRWGRLPKLGWLLALLVALSGCPGSGGGEGADAATPGDAGDEFALPAAETLLPPDAYDCRAAEAPPERLSPAPLGCFHDPSCGTPLVVAHRAGPYFAPENTLSAIRSAIAIGADLVELDTRLTADGDLVLLHDSTVDRTTDATGEADRYTVAELQSLSLVIDPSLPASADFTCERIPTLREALALCKGRIDIMVDLKQGAAEAALQVEAAGMLDQAILLGTQAELEEARAAVPDVRVMIRPRAADEVAPLFEVFTPAPDVVHIDPSFDDAETIAAIAALGIEPGTPKVLINVFIQDAKAALTGETQEYLDIYGLGIGLEQTQFPFFVARALGRSPTP